MKRQREVDLTHGAASSLARPGGNVTGTSLMAPDVVGKQLETLKEIVPKVSRVALLLNPDNPASGLQLREAEAAGRALGMRLHTLEARHNSPSREGDRADDPAIALAACRSGH